VASQNALENRRNKQAAVYAIYTNQTKVFLLLRLLERVRDMVERMLEEVRTAPPLLLLVLALLLKSRVFVHAGTLIQTLMSVKNPGIT
jgi:hypothetical protein